MKINFDWQLGYGCNCSFCKKHTKDKIKAILACKCGCHFGNVIVSHDGLCCEAPNAKHEIVKQLT